STPYRASWEQARMQLPQPMHRSLLMDTLSPEPSLQNFTGQAAMHEWQLTHLSRSTAITAGRDWLMGSPGEVCKPRWEGTLLSYSSLIFPEQEKNLPSDPGSIDGRDPAAVLQGHHPGP